MRWRISFRTSLSGKFLLSYLLIVLVGTATLLVVTFALAPTLFQAQLAPILQTHPGALTTTEAIQHILGVFLGTLLSALAVAAIVATITSLAISLFVARRITLPLRQMTQVSQRISAGHYAERIVIAPVHSTDELGQLASSINTLAVALEQAERRRLEVIGNVAHELRTPIATLEGYLEGLLDVRYGHLVAHGNGHDGALLGSHHSPGDLGRAQSFPATGAFRARPGAGDSATALCRWRDQRG